MLPHAVLQQSGKNYSNTLLACAAISRRARALSTHGDPNPPRHHLVRRQRRRRRYDHRRRPCSSGGAPAEPKAGLKRARPADGTAAPGAATGDGGLQWRAAALKRAMAESERTKRSLEDCVRERWGSVRELTGGQAPEAFLRAADAAARRAPRPRGRRGRGRGRAAPRRRPSARRR